MQEATSADAGDTVLRQELTLPRGAVEAEELRIVLRATLMVGPSHDFLGPARSNAKVLALQGCEAGILDLKPECGAQLDHLACAIVDEARAAYTDQQAQILAVRQRGRHRKTRARRNDPSSSTGANPPLCDDCCPKDFIHWPALARPYTARETETNATTAGRCNWD